MGRLSCGDRDVEVHVVVGGGPAGRKQGFRALELLCPALLVGLHALVVPDLVCEMRIRDGKLRRYVGHDVSVVNDSPPLRQTRSDVGCKSLVSHPWLTVSVELVDMAEEVVDIEGSNCGKS